MLEKVRQDIGVKWVWVENDVSYNGDTAIAWELEQLMSDCDCALFVLGDNPRTSPWLDKEANHAIARELPLVLTQLPNLNAVEPAFTARVQCQSVPWQVEALSEALDKATAMV